MKLATLKGLYDESATIKIFSESCTFGRSRSADFIIAHVNVSRNHCEIIKENTSWKISDYSSSGTYINDLLVGKGNSVLLKNGDIIRFGPLESKLCWTFQSFDYNSEDISSSDSCDLDVKQRAELVLDVRNKDVFVRGKNCLVKEVDSRDTDNLHQSLERKAIHAGGLNSAPEKETVTKSEGNNISTSSNAVLESKMASSLAKKGAYNEEKNNKKIQELKEKLNEVQNALNEMEEKNCLLQEATGSKADVLENLTDLLETEFQCTICSELLIMAVTLSCTHTFCKFCIDQWKRKQKTCPICRKKITNETRSLVVDNYIDKIIGNLSSELKQRRETISKERNSENQPSKKRLRLKTNNS